MLNATMRLHGSFVVGLTPTAQSIIPGASGRYKQCTDHTFHAG